MSKDGSSGESAGQDSGDKDANASIYENRGPKKMVRIITVLAYMFSVSFVAIVLSAYYLFLWEPPNPRLMHSAVRLRADPRVEFLRVEPANDSLEDVYAEGGNVRDRSSYSYEGFDESLTSLKTTIIELLRERSKSNDSSVGQFLRTLGRNESSEKSGDDDDDDDEESERNEKKKHARRKSLSDEDIDGNYNSTGKLLDREEEKEKNGSEDATWTERQTTERVVKQYGFPWYRAHDKLITDNDKTRYSDTTTEERGEKEEEQRQEKTQIEKMTAKSTTMNDPMEHSEISSTATTATTTALGEKSLFQVLTEVTKSKESSAYASSSVTPMGLRTVDLVTIIKPYEENKSRN